MADVGQITTRAKLEVERARARHGSVDILVTTFRRFSANDGGVLAAALTYYTFFSVFPLLLFAASAVGYLTFLSGGIRESLLRSGIEGVPLLNQILTFDMLESLQENRGTLAIVGSLLALYSGSGAVVALEHALNRINCARDEETFFGKRIKSLKWLGFLGVGALASFGTTALVQIAASKIGSGAGVEFLLGVVLSVLSIGVNTGIFATAFKLLPNKERSWRDVLPGAVIAATAFEILKLLGARYLGAGAEGRSQTFGAFSAAAGLLVASYLLSQIILLAAEVNAVLAERRETRSSQVERSQQEA
ncbi:MAG: YihY/virulence factor BrkB family protein [Actinobacteria bacterium]|nr:YihY/virulence factor BrkB family protein [Actinomycetota bacterium]